jgi:hypothetical protein
MMRRKFMFEINLIDLIVIILAAFRLTHLIVFDEIAAFIRNPFISVIEKEDSAGNKDIVIEIKGKGIRHFIGGLLSCYWCTGFWVSLGTILTYFYLPILYPVLLIFAVAGAASVIESKI